MSFIPSGDALLLTRYGLDQFSAGAVSYALLETATGKERWIWTQLSFPFLLNFNVFTPDGLKVYTGSSCESFANFPAFTCTSGASIYAVTLSNGKATALAGPAAAVIFPVLSDTASGITLVSSSQNLVDSSLSGIANDGSLAWSIEGAPAPAAELYPVTVYARTLYYRESSRSSDFTAYLTSASLPAASGAASSPVNAGAIAGGVLGGVLLVALSGVAFSQRAALGSTIRAALARSAPASTENTSLLVDHARKPRFEDHANRPRSFVVEPQGAAAPHAAPIAYQDAAVEAPKAVPTFSRSFSKSAAPARDM